MDKQEVDAKVRELIAALVDQGLIVEAGWVSYRMLVMPNGVSQVQLDETKKGFFAGAHHLFGCMMASLDEGAEPTDADLRRMDNIHQELVRFMAEMKTSMS